MKTQKKEMELTPTQIGYGCLLPIAIGVLIFWAVVFHFVLKFW